MSAIKIGIDLVPLRSDPRRRGISNYSYHLVQALISQFPEQQYFFFNTQGIEKEFIKKNAKNYRLFPFGIDNNLSKKLDVFLFTNLIDLTDNPIHPKNLSCRKLAVVHDLIPVLFYDNYLKKFPESERLKFFERLLMITQLDRIITLSESAKNDLHTILEYPHEKIEVIYSGISKIPPKPDCRRKAENFIFSLPSMDGRKNVNGLIKAYSLLPENLQQQYRLMITCEVNQPYLNQMLAWTKQCGVRGKVIFTDYLLESEVIDLLSRATLFVFPSLYEGFGLPVLEAMAFGVPVITSDNSSLAEISHSAARLVDPYNPQQIADAMAEVLSNPSLRNSMSEQGITHSAHFTWHKSANLLMNALRT